ncbi:TonB-dependent siderophore receptor [Leptolyngbya sp. FACHB-17]|uniref:TonB-dependent siderophore receptor n=1 Tax=unclassified Leptolyngbya TaxID=2650499 RepID=UPI0016816D0E|nr:TonB-dependent siderophore receptor [Leptolyngbya sp. FACHB-17]MBD2081994.1 TonB-dependent siderophore receptor [Leptolyngbya sp. FACHB-17]
MLKAQSFTCLGVAGLASVLMAQSVWAEATQITAVQVKPTSNGIELFLESTSSQPLQVFTTRDRQTLIADIANAQLSKSKAFRQDNPADGIASIAVTPFGANTVRVTIVGKAGLPSAQVVQNTQRLVLSVTASSTAATTPLSPSELTLNSAQTNSNSATQPAQPEQSADGEEKVSQSTSSAPAGSVTQSEEESADEEEVVVTGDQESGYRAPSAATATRTDTPLRDIPQSIQVIPRQVIQDQQVTRIGDAVRNVSGVTVLQGYGGSTDRYTIRGLEASSNLRNGFRDDGFLAFTDPANIERIEVLKGPASVLYGQFEPGGVVNYVTKKPLSNPYYSGELRIGSYNFYRPSIDVSGPLTPDKSVLYRLNLAYENAGSFRDFVNNEVFVAAPVLTFKLGNATNLALEYEYIKIDRTFDRGFPSEPEIFRLPIRRFLGEPSDRYRLTANKPSLTLEHQFSPNLRLRSAFTAQIFDADRSNAQARTFRLQPDRETLRRRYTVSEEKAEDFGLQTDLISNFNTGSVRHELLAGIELSRNTYDAVLRRTEFTPINIFNPVYGSPIPTDLDTVFDNDRRSDTLGIYLQDQIALRPNLKLLVGGRLDLIDFENEDRLIDTTSSRNYTAFSPRVGIVYQPIEPVSLYASFSQSFKPNALAVTSNGGLLEPERGTQYEVGVKSELLGGRLSATLAAYSITKTNVATTDPNDIDFSIAAGEIKSRGIELDVVGRLAPGWNVIASYAYNDAFVSKDNSLPVGSRLVNAPQHSASLWTTYEIQSGSLKGLGFGGGIFFVGDREAELPNTIELPSFVRGDATIFYRRNNYRAAINFKNLFGTRYYEAQGSLVYPGSPFTVVGSLSVEF